MAAGELDAPNHRVTNQDLDRRIGHVEGVVEQHAVRLHELGNAVNVIGLKVEHSQEMIRVRFEGLESKVDTVVAKLDAILEQNATVRSDPAASSAGRQILAELTELKQWRDQIEPTIDGARSVMTAWRILAGGSLLTTIVALAALANALGWWQ
jgi:hypothetical protein